jgi:hypothetical protein
MNPNGFDSLLELLGLGVKIVVSQSKLKPSSKETMHFVTDVVKSVLSEINCQIEVQKKQKILDEVIVVAKACNIERLELVLLDGNAKEPLFLVFGGDYKRFFQVLNSALISLQDDFAFAQKVSEARKQSRIVIYQRQ